GITAGDPETVVNPVMFANKIGCIHNKCVAFPATDGFAVEAAHRNVRIRVLPPIEVNDAHAVHQLTDHVNRGRQLNHGDGPHTGHHDGHTGGPAEADVVLIQ